MKKVKSLLAIVLVLMVLLPMALVVQALGAKIQFTGNSQFQVGGTATVDDMATRRAVMDDGSVTADIYNACLEGTVGYYWFRDGEFCYSGNSYTFVPTDAGCTFYVRMEFYTDADCINACGYLISDSYTIPGGTKLEITTEALPNATVGEKYYQKLDCTNDDATFSLFRSSLPDGLYLTQHGEIEGTPTKAGFWYVVVMISFEGQENTKEYEFYVDEPISYDLEVWQEPTKMEYVQGEKLDLTGLHVRIIGPDGYIDSYNGDKLEYYTGTLDEVGDRKIQLSYQGSFTMLLVVVKPAPVQETTAPTTEPATEAAPTEPVETTEGIELIRPTEATVDPDALPGTAVTKEPESGATLSLFGITVGGAAAVILLILLLLLVLLLPVALIVIIIMIIVAKKKGGKKPKAD